MFVEKSNIKQEYEDNLIVDRDEYIVFKIDKIDLDSFLKFVNKDCQIESGVQINELNTMELIVRYYPFTMDTKKHINKYDNLLTDYVILKNELKTDKKISELDTNMNKNEIINELAESVVDNTEEQLTDDDGEPVFSREHRKEEMKALVENNYDTKIKSQYFESKIIKNIIYSLNIFYLDVSDDVSEIEFREISKSNLSDYTKPRVLRTADGIKHNPTALDIFDIYYNNIDCGYKFQYGDGLDIIRDLIKKYDVSDVLFCERECKQALKGFDEDINQLVVKLKDSHTAYEFLEEFRDKTDKNMLTTHIDKDNNKNVVFWKDNSEYTILNNQSLMMSDAQNNKIDFDVIEIDKYKNATLYKDNTEIELDLRGLDDKVID